MGHLFQQCTDGQLLVNPESEVASQRVYRTRSEAETGAFSRIKVLRNGGRRHSPLDCLSPETDSSRAFAAMKGGASGGGLNQPCRVSASLQVRQNLLFKLAILTTNWHFPSLYLYRVHCRKPPLQSH